MATLRPRNQGPDTPVDLQRVWLGSLPIPERLDVLFPSPADRGALQQPLLQALMRDVCEVFGCDLSVLSLHHAGAMIGYAASEGNATQEGGVPTEETICRLAMAQERVLIITEPETLRRCHTHMADPAMVALAPLLRADGTCIGALSLFFKQMPQWNDHQERLLVKFADLSVTRVELLTALSRERRDHDGLRERVAVLQESEARYRALFASNADAVWYLDCDGRLIDANAAGERMMGFTAEELFGWRYREHVTGDGVLRLERAIDRVAKGEEGGCEITFRHKGGEELTLAIQPIPVRSGDQTTGIFAVIRDVTQRKVTETALEFLAYHDPLTELPNRTRFIERLTQVLRRPDRWDTALMYIDLDRFKIVNDSLGHQAGDRLLVAAAQRLKSTVRDHDLVCRLGGDEFAILLENIGGLQEATRMAARIVAIMATPFELDGQEIFVTPSVGIVHGAPSTDANEMLRFADLAMYQAKQRGKSRYEVFSEMMSIQAQERLRLETDLRRAVDRKEFLVYYQPIVSLSDGRIKGVEALVRWDHPRRGLVSPGEFIPLAEETGLIRRIGRHVLEEACRQTRLWQEEIPDAQDLYVSVNLSARQMQTGRITNEIMDALDKSGLRPESLELELTETMVMQDDPGVLSAFHDLRSLGVSLAIDDFGTGYSSLGYLKQLPVNTLKIDRAFVIGVGANPEDTAIVKAVISFAKTLGLTVTGEGIENRLQMDRLRELGCDRGQGFLFQRPVPASTISQILKSGAHW